MASPIRRIVQLVYDRDAARRTERDAKKSLSTVDRGLRSLKRAALSLGAALGAAFVTRKIFQFGKESIRVAAEANAIWTRLAGTINNAGGNFEELAPRIRQTARAMQDATTVGDEDFAATLQSLINISQDVEGSMQNVALAADLAASANIDLNTAALLVGRAMVGQTSLLSRYGIVVREGEDAIQVMRDQFGGMAENEAASLEGKLKQLNNEWEDFKQAVGEALIEASGGTSILEALIEVVKNLAMWVDRNKDAFGIFAEFLMGTLDVAGALAGAIGRVSNALSGFFSGLMSGGLRLLSRFVEGMTLATRAAGGLLRVIGADDMADQVQRMTDRLESHVAQLKFRSKEEEEIAAMLLRRAFAQREVNEAEREGRESQVGIDPTIAAGEGNVPPEVVDEDTQKEIEELAKKGASVFEATRTATERYNAEMKELDRLLEAGAISQETYNRAAAMARRELEESRKAADEGADAVSRVDEAMKAHQTTMETNRTLASALGDEYGGLAEEARSIEATLRVLAEEGIGPTDERFASLVERLREVRKGMVMTGEEATQMGEIATTAGALVGAAFGSGIGPLAAAKARQNAILAAEHAVQALVSALNPFTAANAGAHLTAAAKFGAISSAWAGLAGSLGSSVIGGGGRIGTGGGGGGVSPGRDFGGRRGEGVGGAETEVHIHFVGPGFDAVNPEVQRVVAGAQKMAEERYGENTRVRVHRRKS